MIWTRAELRAEGVGSSTIDDRCRRGIYTRVFPSIYCLGAPTARSRCQAVIAWIPAAVLSHRTAAWLRGMLPEPDRIEATIPKSSYRKAPPWLRLYRRDLPPAWIEEVRDLPVTTSALTLMDCVTVLPESAANALIDENLGRTTALGDVFALCQTSMCGAPGLRKQLRQAATRYASEPERLFARALTSRGLHLLANHWVGPYKCDFVDERSRVVIEIDGREFHSESGVFERDRRRQNWIALDGWLILRYAAVDVYRALDVCADQVVAVVRRRREGRRG